MSGVDAGRPRTTWGVLMGEMITRRVLLARLAPDLFPASLPGAGATDDRLADVEQRLGFPLDPGHRELLGHGDGWRDHFADGDLLSTQELGTSEQWQQGLDLLDRLYAGGAPAGFPAREHLYPIHVSAAALFVIDRAGPATEGSHPVYWLSDELLGAWSDTEGYWRAGLELLDRTRARLEAELGAPGTDPLDEGRIALEHLLAADGGRRGQGAALIPAERWRALVGALADRRRPLSETAHDNPPRTLPGALPGPSALHDAEARLGFVLDPQHAALLREADGWAGFGDGDLLAAADLGGGPLWQRANAILDRVYRDAPPGTCPPRAHVYPIHTSDGRVAVVWRRGPGTDGGQPVLRLGGGSVEQWPNVFAFCRHVLEQHEDRVDPLPAPGPWWRRWRRPGVTAPR